MASAEVSIILASSHGPQLIKEYELSISIQGSSMAFCRGWFFCFIVSPAYPVEEENYKKNW